jgi:uncharacterized SAM-binding protein YcdF (DUF218 family)
MAGCPIASDEEEALISAIYAVPAAGLAAVVSIAASELWHRQASRSGPGADARQASGSRALVVLGFPSRRHGRLHAVQKWRTEIALRSLSQAADGVLVFTGGPSRGAAVSEAETMAAHARRLHFPDHRILLETKARSTWENLSLSLTMVDTFDTIVMVSDPVHAARARRYAVSQRPDLAGRLAFADDYRFLERWWLKTPIAAHELLVLVRDRVLRGKLRRS